MYKLFFYLLIPILSLSSLPALAVGCAGSGQALEWRPSSAGNPSFLNGSSYSSDNIGPVGALTLHLTNNFTCQGDYQDTGRSFSRLHMPLNSGLTCKNTNTISINGVSGVEWQLSGLNCNNNQLESTAYVSTTSRDKYPYWSRGLALNATATLQVTNEYWRNYPQVNKRTITIPLPSNAITQSKITIGPKQNTTLTVMNVSTCTIALSPENLDFGKLSLNDIRSGKGASKDFALSYRCSNGAGSAYGGVKLYVEPEIAVNTQQGTFGARDKDGNMLTFQLKDTYYSPPSPISLNTENGFLQSSLDDGISAGTRNYRIQVLFPAQQPYPFGAVSTYLNFKLIYR